MSTKKNHVEGITFLICEAIFCLAFLSACEIPNWTKGPRSPNQCVDRWMFAAGLFFPSGLQTGLSGISSAQFQQPIPTGSRTGRSKTE